MNGKLGNFGNEGTIRLIYVTHSCEFSQSERKDLMSMSHSQNTHFDFMLIPDSFHSLLEPIFHFSLDQMDQSMYVFHLKFEFSR